jgi:hypothetical protein
VLVIKVEIKVVETVKEINSYKQVAGQAIFEIGRRLKWVKENDLVHGEWENWCSKNINMSSRQARKYIKVFTEFEKRKLTSDMNLSLDAMNLLVDFNDEQIQQEHTVPSSGEQKTVEEMTVRELREVKLALKKAEEERNKLGQLLTEERNKPSKVETKIVETVKEINSYKQVAGQAGK